MSFYTPDDEFLLQIRQENPAAPAVVCTRCLSGQGFIGWVSTVDEARQAVVEHIADRHGEDDE